MTIPAQRTPLRPGFNADGTPYSPDIPEATLGRVGDILARRRERIALQALQASRDVRPLALQCPSPFRPTVLTVGATEVLACGRSAATVTVTVTVTPTSTTRPVTTTATTTTRPTHTHPSTSTTTPPTTTVAPPPSTTTAPSTTVPPPPTTAPTTTVPTKAPVT